MRNMAVGEGERKKHKWINDNFPGIELLLFIVIINFIISSPHYYHAFGILTMISVRERI